MQNHTRKLLEFILNTNYKDIPEEALEEAKRHFLDCVGAALAESVMERPKIVRGYLDDIENHGPCHILGSGREVSVDYAAFANGILSFTICFDDSGPSHPSVTVVPTLLAVGEWKHLSGKELLTAQVLAYDIFQRLNAMTKDAWEMRVRGWHPTGFFGAVTSAAICAKLLDYDIEKSLQSVSIAATMGGGLSQNIGTMGMGLHAGTACRNGVNAALLARQGFVCADNPLTGRFGLMDALCGPGQYDPEELTRDFGKPFRVLDPGITIKPYPNCWAHHKVYDATLELKKKYRIDPENVEAIYVDLQTEKPTYHYTDPRTDLEARYSLGYGIAQILLEGQLGLEQYDADIIRAERIRTMIGKIKDTPAEGNNQQRIVIKMKDGNCYEAQKAWSKGHPRFAPLTQQELREKYETCAVRAIGEKRAAQTYDAMMHLEQIDDISELIRALIQQ